MNTVNLLIHFIFYAFIEGFKINQLLSQSTLFTIDNSLTIDATQYFDSNNPNPEFCFFFIYRRKNIHIDSHAKQFSTFPFMTVNFNEKRIIITERISMFSQKIEISSYLNDISQENEISSHFFNEFDTLDKWIFFSWCYKNNALKYFASKEKDVISTKGIGISCDFAKIASVMVNVNVDAKKSSTLFSNFEISQLGFVCEYIDFYSEIMLSAFYKTASPIKDDIDLTFNKWNLVNLTYFHQENNNAKCDTTMSYVKMNSFLWKKYSISFWIYSTTTESDIQMKEILTIASSPAERLSTKKNYYLYQHGSMLLMNYYEINNTLNTAQRYIIHDNASNWLFLVISHDASLNKLQVLVYDHCKTLIKTVTIDGIFLNSLNELSYICVGGFKSNDYNHLFQGYLYHMILLSNYFPSPSSTLCEENDLSQVREITWCDFSKICLSPLITDICSNKKLIAAHVKSQICQDTKILDMASLNNFYAKIPTNFGEFEMDLWIFIKRNQVSTFSISVESLSEGKFILTAVQQSLDKSLFGCGPMMRVNEDFNQDGIVGSTNKWIYIRCGLSLQQMKKNILVDEIFQESQILTAVMNLQLDWVRVTSTFGNILIRSLRMFNTFINAGTEIRYSNLTGSEYCIIRDYHFDSSGDSSICDRINKESYKIQSYSYDMIFTDEMSDNKTFTSCALGEYINEGDGTCLPIKNVPNECEVPLDAKGKCAMCKQNFFLLNDTCLTSCPTGYQVKEPGHHCYQTATGAKVYRSLQVLYDQFNSTNTMSFSEARYVEFLFLVSMNVNMNVNMNITITPFVIIARDKSMEIQYHSSDTSQSSIVKLPYQYNTWYHLILDNAKDPNRIGAIVNGLEFYSNDNLAHSPFNIQNFSIQSQNQNQNQNVLIEYFNVWKPKPSVDVDTIQVFRIARYRTTLTTLKSLLLSVEHICSLCTSEVYVNLCTTGEYYDSFSFDHKCKKCPSECLACQKDFGKKVTCFACNVRYILINGMCIEHNGKRLKMYNVLYFQGNVINNEQSSSLVIRNSEYTNTNTNNSYSIFFTLKAFDYDEKSNVRLIQFAENLRLDLKFGKLCLMNNDVLVFSVSELLLNCNWNIFLLTFKKTPQNEYEYILNFYIGTTPYITALVLTNSNSSISPNQLTLFNDTYLGISTFLISSKYYTSMENFLSDYFSSSLTSQLSSDVVLYVLYDKISQQFVEMKSGTAITQVEKYSLYADRNVIERLICPKGQYYDIQKSICSACDDKCQDCVNIDDKVLCLKCKESFAEIVLDDKYYSVKCTTQCDAPYMRNPLTKRCETMDYADFTSFKNFSIDWALGGKVLFDFTLEFWVYSSKKEKEVVLNENTTVTATVDVNKFLGISIEGSSDLRIVGNCNMNSMVNISEYFSDDSWSLLRCAVKSNKNIMTMSILTQSGDNNRWIQNKKSEVNNLIGDFKISSDMKINFNYNFDFDFLQQTRYISYRNLKIWSVYLDDVQYLSLDYFLSDGDVDIVDTNLVIYFNTLTPKEIYPHITGSFPPKTNSSPPSTFTPLFLCDMDEYYDYTSMLCYSKIPPQNITLQDTDTCGTSIPYTSQCLLCPQGFFLRDSDLQCVKTCTEGSYLDTYTSMCKTCSPVCKSCFGNSNSNCISCHMSHYFQYSIFKNQTCISQCSEDELFDHEIQQCIKVNDCIHSIFIFGKTIVDLSTESEFVLNLILDTCFVNSSENFFDLLSHMNVMWDGMDKRNIVSYVIKHENLTLIYYPKKEFGYDEYNPNLYFHKVFHVEIQSGLFKNNFRMSHQVLFKKFQVIPKIIIYPLDDSRIFVDGHLSYDEKVAFNYYNQSQFRKNSTLLYRWTVLSDDLTSIPFSCNDPICSGVVLELNNRASVEVELTVETIDGRRCRLKESIGGKQGMRDAMYEDITSDDPFYINPFSGISKLVLMKDALQVVNEKYKLKAISIGELNESTKYVFNWTEVGKEKMNASLPKVLTNYTVNQTYILSEAYQSVRLNYIYTNSRYVYAFAEERQLILNSYWVSGQRNFRYSDNTTVINLSCSTFPIHYFPFHTIVKFSITADSALYNVSSYKISVTDSNRLTYYITNYLNIDQNFETEYLPHIIDYWVDVILHNGLHYRMNCSNSLTVTPLQFSIIDSLLQGERKYDLISLLRHVYFYSTVANLTNSEKILGYDIMQRIIESNVEIPYETVIQFMAMSNKSGVLSYLLSCNACKDYNNVEKTIGKIIEILIEMYHRFLVDVENISHILSFINQAHLETSFTSIKTFDYYKMKFLAIITSQVQENRFPIEIGRWVKIYQFDHLNSFQGINIALGEFTDEEVYCEIQYKDILRYIYTTATDWVMSVILEKREMSVRYIGNVKVASEYVIDLRLLYDDKNSSTFFTLLNSTSYLMFNHYSNNQNQNQNQNLTCVAYEPQNETFHACESWFNTTTYNIINATCICTYTGLISVVNDTTLSQLGKDYQFRLFDIQTARKFILCINIIFICPNIILFFYSLKRDHTSGYTDLALVTIKKNSSRSLVKSFTSWDFHTTTSFCKIFFYAYQKLNDYLILFHRENEFNLFIASHDMNKVNTKHKVMHIIGRVIICLFLSICPFYFLPELDKSKEKIMNSRNINDRFINIYDLPTSNILIGLSFAFCVTSAMVSCGILYGINVIMFKNPGKIENKIKVKMLKNFILDISLGQREKLSKKLRKAVECVIFALKWKHSFDINHPPLRKSPSKNDHVLFPTFSAIELHSMAPTMSHVQVPIDSSRSGYGYGYQNAMSVMQDMSLSSTSRNLLDKNEESNIVEEQCKDMLNTSTNTAPYLSTYSNVWKIENKISLILSAKYAVKNQQAAVAKAGPSLIFSQREFLFGSSNRITCFSYEYNNSHKVKPAQEDFKFMWSRNYTYYTISFFFLLGLWLVTQFFFIECLNKFGYRIIYIWILPNVIVTFIEIFLFESMMVMCNVAILMKNSENISFRNGRVRLSKRFRWRKIFSLMNKYKQGVIKYLVYAIFEFKRQYDKEGRGMIMLHSK